MSDDLERWVGRVERTEDVVTAWHVQAACATLGLPMPDTAGGEVPLLLHWIFFRPLAALSEIDADGHPKRGGFLPPVPLPRRMWAGSRIAFDRRLRVGQTIRRVSTIDSCRRSEGRAGPLIFVCVKHEISDEDGMLLREEQDIVYREASVSGAAAPGAVAPRLPTEWARRIVADPVLLFRYSALTFNGHRIHYDRTYSNEKERYPGLVVHGPLVATLLLSELSARSPGLDMARFCFRAVRPLFDTEPFEICGSPEADGRTIALYARDAGGALCMKAEAIAR